MIGKKNLENEIIDTLVLARNKFPGSSASLDALCKRYGIDNSRRTNHTALLDCDLLAKVYINLIDQKEPKLNFENQVSKSDSKQNVTNQYFKKIVSISKQEIKNHEKYLKTSLKKNFF